MSERRVVEDFACTACGCVCDDLRVELQDDMVQAFEPPCPLAASWFARRAGAIPASEPTAWIEGVPATRKMAIARAVELLAASRAPLIYGLSSSSTPGQRAATRLADRLGATIDTSASTCHGPSIVALQQVGESTCTLGEIALRADLIVYWGSNPLVSHPRHLERYALPTTRPRESRTLVVVDTERTATAELADEFVCLDVGSDFEVLWALRAALAGQLSNAAGTVTNTCHLGACPPESAEAKATGAIGGVPVERLRALAERLRSCRCGVFFFGRGLAQGPVGHANVAALLLLTRDLNGHTRFHARRMRVYGDVAGADMVLAWQTGFPFSVNLARGYPRYSPGEYSASELLARGEVDCCLLVGDEGLDTLGAAALARLRTIPTIRLDVPSAAESWTPTVRLSVASYGVHLAGTAYRMDEVPIPLRPLCDSPLPADHELLHEILRGL